jgi:hypothetical protein
MNDNSMAGKKCAVCAMPLGKAEDCACNDMSKDYCKYCGDEKGIYSFEKLVAGMTAFIKSQGIDITEKEAEAKALEIVENSAANKDGRIEKESGEETEEENVDTSIPNMEEVEDGEDTEVEADEEVIKVNTDDDQDEDNEDSDDDENEKDDED